MDRISPGRVLNGKWTVGAPLGESGWATLYDVSHRNGMSAAVAVLYDALACDEAAAARLVRDAAALTRLDPLGEVAVFDDDTTDDGLVYVVFERLTAPRKA